MRDDVVLPPPGPDVLIIRSGISTKTYDLQSLMNLLPAFELTKRPDGSYKAIWRGHENGITYLEADSRTSATYALARLAVMIVEAGVLQAPDGGQE